jgi:hypothetical protein
VSVRSILTWIGASAGVASLGFVVHRLIEHRQEIPNIPWTWSALGSLAGAVVLSGVPVAIGAIAMSRLLRATGISLTWRESFAIVGQSQIGKYLPGNVFHYLGRAALGVRRGLPIGPLSIAIGAETAFTIAVAIAMAAVGALSEGVFTDPRLHQLRNVIAWSSVGLATIAVVGLSISRVRRRASGFLMPRCVYCFSTATPVVVMLSTLALASLGGAIALLVHGVFGVESSWNWLQFTWRFALIWVLGLVSVGAPAGLGVREALMLIWLSPAVGDSTALALAGLLRVVTVTADVLVFALAWLVDCRRRATVSTAST